MNRRDALENNLVSMKEMEAQKSVTNILFYLFIVFVNHISIPKWLKIHVSLKKKKKFYCDSNGFTKLLRFFSLSTL